jgi:DNA-binding transcriptional MerR regulator
MWRRGSVEERICRLDNAVEHDEPEITFHEQVGRSIRVVSRITGLSIDTLRMWERRYGFPTPLRSSSGNRIYSESEVKRLQLVVKALKVGYRVSDALRLDESALVELLANPSVIQPETDDGVEHTIERLLGLLRSHELDELSRVLRRESSRLGGQPFIVKVVAPLLQSTGEAWAAGTLAIYQEHLLSNLLAAELTRLSNAFDNPDGPAVLFATLPRERHGLSLQMIAVYCQHLGVRPYVVGTDLPLTEIVQAVNALGAQAVALSASSNSPVTAVHDHLEVLARDLPEAVQIWLGGRGAQTLEHLPSKVRLLTTWEALELAVNGLLRGL